jgi:hypothetical protein
MKKTLFLILSGAIVIFSIICICSAPIINSVIPLSSSWKTENCQKLADEYKQKKEGSDNDATEKAKKEKNKCNREKAMYGLEYSSLIIDVSCGFVCTILGLLHYFEIAKPFEKVTGIIGLSTGIIGFVLTLIYVIYSGYIFTNDPYEDSSSNIYKTDDNWAFAKFENGKGYKCLFYKDKDENSALAKYSDLGKKQYNYNKEKSQDYTDTNSKLYKCSYDSSGISGIIIHAPSNCKTHEYIPSSLTKIPDCDYIYIKPVDTISNKYLFDRWITTIIFSCFIFACDIGLAIFGFLLFKSDGSGI